MNYDVHEACNLNVHWHAEYQQMKKIRSMWNYFPTDEITKYMKDKSHISSHFHIILIHLSFDWRSFDYVTLFHPPLMQWFNGTQLENLGHQHNFLFPKPTPNIHNHGWKCTFICITVCRSSTNWFKMCTIFVHRNLQ